MRRSISRDAAERDPNAIWNAFVNLLAHSNYDELSDIQRVAHLAFWYDTEVQNGGHLQYFLNRPEDLIEPTTTGLKLLGAEEQMEILGHALRRWNDQHRATPKTTDEYKGEAMIRQFEDLDTRFYGVTPDVTQLLEGYLNRHLSEFIVVEE
jgi:hypothetical protein